MEGGTEIGVLFQKSKLEMNKEEECITGSFLLAPFFSLTIGNRQARVLAITALRQRHARE